MPIGIGAYGSNAVRAVYDALKAAEKVGAGAIGAGRMLMGCALAQFLAALGRSSSSRRRAWTASRRSAKRPPI